MIAAISPRTTFVIKAFTWSLVLFGAIRLPWIERTFVQALIDLQSVIAHWYGAPSGSAVAINASCSGADVMSLCVGVTLAYPVMWRRRVAGAAMGVGVILILNTLRIGTLLGMAAAGPRMFSVLHETVWPAILVVSILGFVWHWLQVVDRPSFTVRTWTKDDACRRALTRFWWTAASLVALHLMAAPWTMTSAASAAASRGTAHAAQAVLSVLGVKATAQEALLVTSRGAFQVTGECLLTPLLPLYLAAILSFPLGPLQRALAMGGALPFFFVLGVSRVLVLALPAQLVTEPMTLVHGFYEIALAGVLTGVAAIQGPLTAGEPNTVAVHPVLRWTLAVGGGVAAAAIAGPVLARADLALADALRSLGPHALASFTWPDDVQGALVLMPSYQVGLLTGLWLAIASKRRSGPFAVALAALIASQVLCLIAAGEWFAHTSVVPHALILRAWSVGVPASLAWALFSRERRGEPSDSPVYRSFWQGVGRDFPDLGGAPSTRFYFENEKRLLLAHVPHLDACRFLKTDLWDEAKNTRILQWTAARGARTFGIDVSEPIVRDARTAFDPLPAGFSRADVRWLPFAEGSFDAIYSMGTLEHFEGTEHAVRELARALKPGGRLILGVPNRHDPFLRPLLVRLLTALGLYGYGFEKAYSRAELKGMLEDAGLTVIEETGILFIPGWLRMLDLACHVWCRPLTSVTGPAVGVFARLDRRYPRLRRHGYLLASVAIRPAHSPSR